MNNLIKSNWQNSTPPMPSSNLNRSWTQDATVSWIRATPGTVWLFGYIKPSISSIFVFHIQTTQPGLLFWSHDGDPENKELIANDTSRESRPITLTKDRL